MNCMFRSNRADVDGGAVLNNTSSILFMNCGFTGNSAGINAGAIYNQGGSTPSSPIQTFRNCSFVNNSAGSTNSPTTGNGAIVCSQFGTVVMTNSIVYNSGGSKTFYRDPQYSITITNSLLDANATNYTNSGGVFLTFTSPFFDETTLTIQPCSPALNGSTNVTTGNLGTTDLAGNNRFVGSTADLGAVEYQSASVPAVSAGSIVSAAGTNTIICTNASLPNINSINNGFSVQKLVWETRLNNAGSWSVVAGATSPALASPGSMSASASSISFRRAAYDCTGNPQYTNVITYVQSNTTINVGAIAGPPIVPFPPEFANMLTSQTNASATVTPITLRWQQSEDNGTNWINIPNSNVQAILLPTISPGDAVSKTFQFRRIITNACSLTAASASVPVRVVAAEGRISGRVVSGDGITPVVGVTITAVRNTTGLAGSPNSVTYTAITGANGTYDLAPLYYGVRQGTTPVSLTAATFTIVPRYGNHVFIPASQTALLTQFITPVTLLDFKDQTTFALSGQTFHSCPDCLTNGVAGSVTCPLDSVEVRVFRGADLIMLTRTRYLDTPSPGNYGRWAAAVSNPGTYSIVPTYRNQVFTPVSRTVNVTDNVYSLNFSTSALQTIQGRVTAGCGVLIGTATLEFTDVMQASDGSLRSACFIKRATTNAQGFYSIQLPPRKYKVRAVSFTPSGGANPVSATDFVTFINNLPADSTTRDLTSTTAITTLNLTYERAPIITVTGLVSPAICGTASAFSVMNQAVDTPIAVQIFQGPVSLGCPVSGGTYTVASGTTTSGTATNGTATSGTLTVTTDVQTGSPEVIRPGFVNGVASLTLLPGNPNVVAPYRRNFTIQFIDKYGRAATNFMRPIVVVGVKPGDATFETVSPQIPYMVLHDPPGDGSVSFWETNTKTESAMKLSVNRNFNQNIWADVKIGVEYDIGMILSYKLKVNYNVGAFSEISESVNRANELITTNTVVQKIATSGLPGITGAAGDVYIGGAMNLIYAVATEVKFITGTCSLTTSRELIVANRGLATTFYYTDSEIRNGVIPRLKDLKALSTSAVEREDYDDQVANWEDILKKNEDNKKKAAFVSNKTFNGGVGEITESITKALTRKITYEGKVEFTEQVATEIGAEFAGNGIKGGVKLKI